MQGYPCSWIGGDSTAGRLLRDQSDLGRSLWYHEMRRGTLLLRNFWFCCIEEPRSMEHRRHIGTDKIMLEVDYPHSDTSWPDTQARVDEMLDGLPAQEVRQISHANAAAVYRHPVPTDPQWAR